MQGVTTGMFYIWQYCPQVSLSEMSWVNSFIDTLYTVARIYITTIVWGVTCEYSLVNAHKSCKFFCKKISKDTLTVVWYTKSLQGVATHQQLYSR